MSDIKPGAIGVMLSDTHKPARMYRFLGMHSCMIGIFESIEINAGLPVGFNVSEFWPLIDADHAPG